jgi:hypothetical protein
MPQHKVSDVLEITDGKYHIVDIGKIQLCQFDKQIAGRLDYS